MEASSHGVGGYMSSMSSISFMSSHGSRASCSDTAAETVHTPPLPSKRAALPLAERLSRFLRCRCLRADAGEGERLYTLTVCYQQHRWARLFGLSTTSQVSCAHTPLYLALSCSSPPHRAEPSSASGLAGDEAGLCLVG